MKKNAMHWAVQTVLFVIYCLIVYNLALPNFWLSAIISLLLVYAFSNANKITKLHQAIKTGMVGALEVNDNMHNQHAQNIEDLTDRIAELEEQLRTLKEKFSDMENHTFAK